MQEEAYAVRLGLKDSSSNFPMKPVGQPRVSSHVLPELPQRPLWGTSLSQATRLSRKKYRLTSFDLIAVSLTLRVSKQWSLNQDQLRNKDIKRTKQDKLITKGSCLLETQMLEINGRVSKSKTRIDADLTRCQEAFSLSFMGTQTSEILEKTSI